jgi:hypothetical protein
MQELYNQKQILRDEIQKSENNLEDLKLSTTLKSSITNADDYKSHRLSGISAYETSSNLLHQQKYPINNVYLGEEKENEKQETASSIDKSSSKPPVAPLRNSVTFQKSHEIIEPQIKQEQLEEQNKLIQSMSDGLQKIEHMWDNFSLKSTNPNLKSIEFNEKFEKKLKKTSGYRNHKKNQQIQIEWQPRVTVPEPFTMSIREQIKQDLKQQKLIKEIQENREKRLDEELKECKRKFKAQPVPAHVTLPLYEQRKMEEDLRKYRLKQMSKEYSEKVIKPFNLTESKSSSMKNLNTTSVSDTEVKNEQKKTAKNSEFIAQPLPDFYFNEFADEE